MSACNIMISVYLDFHIPGISVFPDIPMSHYSFVSAEQKSNWISLGSGLTLSLYRTLSDSMCNACIALQELQAFALILHRMVFCLSGMFVALHVDNSAAKAYLCMKGIAEFLFCSRTTCCILSVT